MEARDEFWTRGGTGAPTDDVLPRTVAIRMPARESKLCLSDSQTKRRECVNESYATDDDVTLLLCTSESTLMCSSREGRRRRHKSKTCRGISAEKLQRSVRVHDSQATEAAAPAATGKKVEEIHSQIVGLVFAVINERKRRVVNFHVKRLVCELAYSGQWGRVVRLPEHFLASLLYDK